MPFRSTIALNGSDYERELAAKFCPRIKALSILLKCYDSDTGDAWDTKDIATTMRICAHLFSPGVSH